MEVDKSIRENKISMSIKPRNIRKEFKKIKRHPVEQKRNPTKDYFVGKSKVYNPDQSECLDCHKGHGVSQESPSPGSAPKKSPKDEKEFEFQLCYICHYKVSRYSLSRTQTDIKTWFATRNPSYHPVETSGKNSNVPSLIEPFNASSIINCTDCHNNSDLNGPRGPHGSDFEFLLERNYNLSDGVSEGFAEYALCYKCHSRESILGDESFPYHNLHVVTVGSSCFICHNSHGSQRNAHLLKYDEEHDPFIIQTSSSGRLAFLDNGMFAGECYLTCHGVDHNPKTYIKISDF